MKPLARNALVLGAVLSVMACDQTPTAPDRMADVEPSLARLKGEKPGVIVYAGLDLDIYAMADDGSKMTNLTNTGEVETFPSLSPDGTTIAYSRGGQIWTVSVFGTSPQMRYANGGAYAKDPAWSPDGAQIAFTHQWYGQDDDIWVMDADGSNATLAAGGAGGQIDPAWSPGGALTWATPDLQQSAGTMKVVFEDMPPTAYMRGRSPAWSPDGTRIAYHSSRPGQGHSFHDQNQLYIYDLASASETRVSFTPDTWDDTEPTWSPGGGKLAFVRDSPFPFLPHSIHWMDTSVYRVNPALTTGKSPSWGVCVSVERVGSTCPSRR